MKYWLRDWFEENWFVVVVAIVGIMVIVGLIVLMLHCNGQNELDTVKWVANPANPASPLNTLK